MRGTTKSRRMKYGSVSAALTILTVAAVVIANVIFTALCGRYGWYVDMSSDLMYKVTEDCKEYLDEYVISEVKKANDSEGGNEKVTILFCDDRENIESEITQNYILGSALEIQEMFPDYVEIDFLNIWENPSIARSYGITASTNVAFLYSDRHVVLSLADFYIFEAADTETPVAYNGEKRLATGMMRVVQENTPMCYLTVNHGETVEDYELMYMIADAGYNYTYLDLLNYDIPEDCELLITFNPTQDFTSNDNVSSVSETDKIREYMNNGGKYMVFVSADTFVSGGHENLEELLAEWGVRYMHSTGEDGIENCYTIKDSMHSTTTDGYTILAQNTPSGFGAEILKDITKPNVFGNSTCISPSDGFTLDPEGNYVSDAYGSTRTLTPLFVSDTSAEAWASGRVVAKATDDPFVLMSLTKQENAQGNTSYLLASASTEFGSESAMQSAVFGNSQTLSTILKYMGKENVPTNLTFKPFGDTDIDSITTAQSTTITIVLAAVPAAVILGTGIVILVKRKNAV